MDSEDKIKCKSKTKIWTALNRGAWDAGDRDLGIKGKGLDFGIEEDVWGVQHIAHPRRVSQRHYCIETFLLPRLIYYYSIFLFN